MTTKNKNSKRGFTLVELLVTISILAVLATVSIVGYVSFIEKANLARDKAIVDQLNQLKNAYAISGETSIDEIIRDSGLTFSEITPASDGHKLYYDTKQNTFVLAKDDEKTDNLQEINEDNFKPKNDEGEKTQPEIKLSIKSKYSNKMNSTSYANYQKYVELENNELNIGNVKDDFVAFNIYDILDNINGDIEVNCTPIATVDYGYNHEHQDELLYVSEEKVITFYCSGRYKLEISCEGEEKPLCIYVNVNNSACNNRKSAELSTTGSASIFTSNYNSEAKTSSVTIHVFGGLKIDDYLNISDDMQGLFTGNKAENKETQESIINSGRLKIFINDAEQTINFTENHYSIQLDNLNIGKHSINIEYRFLSFNGEWVSQTFVFTFNLTSSQANDKNISILP